MSAALLAAAGMATASAVAAWPVRPDPAVRLRALAARAPRPGYPPAGVRTRLSAAAAVGVVAALVAGAPGWFVLLAVAAPLVAVGRRRPPDRPELPLVLDLLASCLHAGAPWPDALTAAAVGAGPELRRMLVEVAAELRDSGEVAAAWQPWQDVPDLAPVARCCCRTGRSGAAVAAELRRLAARLRTRRRGEMQQRAARAGTWVVLPLGLCFLPAFVLVGVVPLAWGLLRGVL